jgi:hypothetical protein
MDKQQIGRTTMTKSLAAFFIATIFSTSFAQMGGMGFGSSGGGDTVDSVRAAGSAQNLQGGATGAIPFQTTAGTTSFDASNLTWDNTNKRLGIGTASPASKLEIAGGDLVISGPAAYKNIRLVDGTTALQITGGSDIADDARLVLHGKNRATLPGNMYFTMGNAGGTRSIVFEADNGGSVAEKMRIQSDGNVGIGMTAPTAVLHLKAGTASATTAPLKFTAGTNLTTAEAGAMEFDGTNLYFTPSSTRQTVTLSSDSSLKRNIVDYRDALQKVLAMRPVHFRYKVGSDTTLHVGLIAQELVHVDSSLVDYATDGEARGVKYLEVIPVLVRAIQEQDARITALEKRNMFFGIFTGVVLVGLVVVIVRRKADIPA